MLYSLILCIALAPPSHLFFPCLALPPHSPICPSCMLSVVTCVYLHCLAISVCFAIPSTNYHLLPPSPVVSRVFCPLCVVYLPFFPLQTLKVWSDFDSFAPILWGRVLCSRCVGVHAILYRSQGAAQFSKLARTHRDRAHIRDVLGYPFWVTEMLRAQGPSAAKAQAGSLAPSLPAPFFMPTQPCTDIESVCVRERTVANGPVLAEIASSFFGESRNQNVRIR